MSDFSLSINIDASSLRALKSGNYKLTVFRGTSGGGDALLSTVWLSIPTEKMGEQNTIKWTDTYQGFVSFSDNLKVASGVTITGTTSRDMELGQGLVISSDENIDYSQSGDKDNALTFHNNGNSIVLGYSMPTRGDGFQPVCAVKVPGSSKTTLMPKNKMLVSFSSDGNIDQSICVSEIDTSAATVEYFDDVHTHTIAFSFDSGVWTAGEQPLLDSSPSQLVGWGNWFKYIKSGVNVLNKVLNN